MVNTFTEAGRGWKPPQNRGDKSKDGERTGWIDGWRSPSHPSWARFVSLLRSSYGRSYSLRSPAPLPLFSLFLFVYLNLSSISLQENRAPVWVEHGRPNIPPPPQPMRRDEGVHCFARLKIPLVLFTTIARSIRCDWLPYCFRFALSQISIYIYI